MSARGAGSTTQAGEAHRAGLLGLGGDGHELGASVP